MLLVIGDFDVQPMAVQLVIVEFAHGALRRLRAGILCEHIASVRFGGQLDGTVVLKELLDLLLGDDAWG